MKPRCYSYLRFSTPEQRFGDSERRQLEATRAYADAHGLILDETLRDEGISGFKGAHKVRGALGRFLADVNAGKVPKGSTLIVESLDRLSREEIRLALPDFLNIINSGVTIVTLTDNREYSAANCDIANLVMSIMVMSRAHEESATKSMRLGAAWAAKKQATANGEIHTNRCPAWLAIEGRAFKSSHVVGGTFKPIKERVDIIKRIFKMYLSGFGPLPICRVLNKEKVPVFGRGKVGWQYSYIKKLLHNRSLLGEYQPYTKRSGKRVKEGVPIPNYFPQVISPDLFARVQARLTAKYLSPAKGTNAIHNLFTGLLKCANCGGSVNYINKGNGGKAPFKYLACSGARRGTGCKYHSVRYEPFERAILQFYAAELELAQLMSGDKETEAQTIQNTLEAREQTIVDYRAQVDNLMDSIATYKGASRERYVARAQSRIDDLENQIAAADIEIKDLRFKLSQTDHKPDEIKLTLTELKALIEKLMTVTGDEVDALRRKIRTRLLALTDRIVIQPDVKTDTMKHLYKKGVKVAVDPFKVTDWWVDIHFKSGSVHRMYGSAIEVAKDLVDKP